MLRSAGRRGSCQRAVHGLSRIGALRPKKLTHLVRTAVTESTGWIRSVDLRLSCCSLARLWYVSSPGCVFAEVNVALKGAGTCPLMDLPGSRCDTVQVG